MEQEGFNGDFMFVDSSKKNLYGPLEYLKNFERKVQNIQTYKENHKS